MNSVDCHYCGLAFLSLGIASHRAACRERQINGGTPKTIVLSKFPKANLVRDGYDRRAGGSGTFDCAIFSDRTKSARFLGQGNTPRAAWEAAARKI